MFNIYVTDINYDDVNGTAQTWVISFNINQGHLTLSGHVAIPTTNANSKYITKHMHGFSHGINLQPSNVNN